ncbi:cortactin-binding protein 2-like [Tubulanus polymorphus]|uniref:cortactin-binding protein 2-like n=1 Tax=Tubulanus polymorphus TaxID=672921 RepID=UPI003DA216CE
MAGRNPRFGSSAAMNRFDVVPDQVTQVPSNTLKRHPKMELSKTDLIQLLSYLEGELQAREVVIAALKAEKAKQLMYQAKYGRFGLTDPFCALQRDSEGHNDKSFDENAIKNMYENQLVQLEKLITVQRKAQIKMKDQIGLTDKKYHKACHELDEERKKHAQDMAQGDDVTYALEKERQRLRNEIDFEKNNAKKCEKELKKLKEQFEEEHKSSAKHKQVAIMLIKERRQMAEKLIAAHKRCRTAEAKMNEERTRTKNMAEGLVEESKKSLKMEAAMEKQLAEFDTEKQQLKMRLQREETKNNELQRDIDHLQQQVTALQKQLNLDKNREGPKSIEIKSSVITGVDKESMPNPQVATTQPVPKSQPKVFRNTPPNTPPELRKNMQEVPEKDVATKPESNIKRAILQLQKSEKPERPTEVVLSPGARVNLNTGASSGTTVFSTPSGGKISFTVAGANAPRKTSPAGRGTPPPVPPNKPVLSASSVQKGLRANTSNLPSVGAGSTKYGQTGVRERSLECPPIEGAKPVTVTSGVPSSSSSQSNMIVTSDGSTARKVSQFVISMSSSSTHLSDFVSIDMDDTETIDLNSAGESSAPSVDLSSNLHSSPLHTSAASGDYAQLLSLVIDNHNDTIDVNETLKDGATAIHCAAENGHEDCLRLLLQHGGNINARRDDKLTPLHAASGAGHEKIVLILLSHGAHVNEIDQSGRTSLYWAARHGHCGVCSLLINHSARIDIVNFAGWGVLHAAINGNHNDCLELLLNHITKHELYKHLLNSGDADGLTPVHLAAMKGDTASLEILVKEADLDLEKKDHYGRTAFDLASETCSVYLSTAGLVCRERHCTVCIEPDHLNHPTLHNSSPFIVGTVCITVETSWPSLEGTLSDLFLNHLTIISKGFHSKSDSKNNNHIKKSPDAPPMLGLTLNSIKYFCMGQHHWSPGTPSEYTPYDILITHNAQQITVSLFGWEDNCQDSLAYEMLLPATTLQNYLRLAEQYRSVVFYGPGGTGKSYLARRLADCIQTKERQKGYTCEVVVITVNSDLKQRDFTSLLIEEGVLLEQDVTDVPSYTPVLVLDDLSKICLSEILRDLLSLIEKKGAENSVSFVRGGKERSYYLPSNCYIIGTMDRSRSTGIELSVQQLFRWVHCRIDTEPYCSLLSRYFTRSLIHIYGGQYPPVDCTVHQALQWTTRVWHRLNEALGKLGLPEIVFGPTHFLSCPVEIGKVTSVFRWMSLFWNRVVVPLVTDAVIRGATSDSESSNHEKVANTTLYVLLQRAVLPGCPINEEEKEEYMAGFQGYNELEMLLKADNSPHESSSLPSSPTTESQSDTQGHYALGHLTWAGRGKKKHKRTNTSHFDIQKSKPSRIPNLVAIHKSTKKHPENGARTGSSASVGAVGDTTVITQPQHSIIEQMKLSAAE